MSVNSSSTSDLLFVCVSIEVSKYMLFITVALRFLFLPLSIFVLYLGHQRWRQQNSSKAATHSDIFTYHVAAMELIWILGSFFHFGGQFTNHSAMVLVGYYLCSVPYSGELFFHVLTCVERYLAVVHPIPYMGLKNARGVRIRNFCLGCIWLLSFGGSGVVLSFIDSTFILSLCILVLSTAVTSFCSLSVLCVLIRPGPGEGGGEKQHDKSKQRAFYTITVISITVWLWSFGLIVSQVTNMSPGLGATVRCVVLMSAGLLNLPSTFVSPLLYLHRAGKLSCCC